MKRSATKQEGESASQLISESIAELDDWRGETLGRIRARYLWTAGRVHDGERVKGDLGLLT